MTVSEMKSASRSMVLVVCAKNAKTPFSVTPTRNKMKQPAQTISIRKQSNGSYNVDVKQGRNTQSFNLHTFNSARSFARRNFNQKGHYSS